MKKAVVLILFVAMRCALFGQSTSFVGDYVYRSQKVAGADVLKLNADSTYKWYFTEGMHARHGQWRCGKDEILLFGDSTAANVKFRVILSEESGRLTLCRKKRSYLKQ